MDYTYLSAAERRGIAEARIRDLERGHFHRSLDLEDAKERGDAKAVDVISEDLGQREATLSEAKAAIDKIAPRPAVVEVVEAEVVDEAAQN